MWWAASASPAALLSASDLHVGRDLSLASCLVWDETLASQGRGAGVAPVERMEPNYRPVCHLLWEKVGEAGRTRGGRGRGEAGPRGEQRAPPRARRRPRSLQARPRGFGRSSRATPPAREAPQTRPRLSGAVERLTLEGVAAELTDVSSDGTDSGAASVLLKQKHPPHRSVSLGLQSRISGSLAHALTLRTPHQWASVDTMIPAPGWRARRSSQGAALRESWRTRTPQVGSRPRDLGSPSEAAGRNQR